METRLKNHDNKYERSRKKKKMETHVPMKKVGSSFRATDRQTRNSDKNISAPTERARKHVDLVAGTGAKVLHPSVCSYSWAPCDAGAVREGVDGARLRLVSSESWRHPPLKLLRFTFTVRGRVVLRGARCGNVQLVHSGGSGFVENPHRNERRCDSWHTTAGHRTPPAVCGRGRSQRYGPCPKKKTSHGSTAG